MVEKNIFKLKNGIKVLLDKKQSHEAVTIIVFFKVGSRDESVEYSGLTHFIEHMFFKGTKKRINSNIITSAIDKYGGEFNASTDYDMTFYYIKINKQHFSVAIELLADLLFHSLFRQKDIDMESQVVLNELKLTRTNPSIYIQEVLAGLHYKYTDMEHSVGGDDDNVITSATSSKMLSYINHHYRPDNTLISICGDVDLNKKLLNKYFGSNTFSYQNNTQYDIKLRTDLNHFRSIQTQYRFLHKLYPVKNMKNSYIAIAFPAWKFNSPEYYACNIIHSLLGANMSSRLFTQLREKQGLTYSVQTDVPSYEDLGSFKISYGTEIDTPTIIKSIKIVMRELRKLKTKLVSPQELTKAKEYLIGQDIIRCENSSYVAQSNGYSYLYTNKVLSTSHIHNQIRSITSKQIQTTSKLLFQKNKLTLVIFSPKTISKSQIKFTL
jgi:predicted Zn-dependent peptidase